MPRVKSGAVSFAEYQKPVFVHRFNQIRRSLQRSVSDVHGGSLSNQQLAQISAELQNFMEAQLGRNSRAPRPMARLPATVFRDFSPTGSLYTVFHTYYTFKVR